MALTLTANTILELLKTNIEPQIAFEIEGVPTIYGARPVLNYIRVGEDNLFIDGSWVIGGLREIANQQDSIDLGSTTNSIAQQLTPDTAQGSSITQMDVALVDFNNEITRLISPTLEVDDVLGRRCRVYLGLANVGFPDDYVVIFRGIVNNINSSQGKVTFNIASPDQKKRQDIFLKAEYKLAAAINGTQTSITLNEAPTQLLQKVLGPNGAYDSSFRSCVLIENELISYDSISGNTLTGCLRGQEFTQAAAHDIDKSATSFYILQGDPMTLAMKLMLSRWGSNPFTGAKITKIGVIDTSTFIQNALYLSYNANDKYGVSVGDYVYISGANNGGNNISGTIEGIFKSNDGFYITITGANFIVENSTNAVMAFRSQFDTLPDGLQMYPDEVDTDKFIEIRKNFLSNFNYKFYLKDDVKGKDFLESEVFKPCGSYPIPRKSKASIGYHSPPIPSRETTILNKNNITNAKELKLLRSINKNFYNTVIYKYDEQVLEEKFTSGNVSSDNTSRIRIPVGTKALVIQSKGMRSSLSGKTLAQDATTKRLNRYKFGAEFFEGITVLYKEGFKVEIGDIILFDPDELNISNTNDGTRVKPAKLYEVTNKTLNIKNGSVSLTIVDTGFSTAQRYGLISPASKVIAASTQTEFQIIRSYNSIWGVNEFLKWNTFTDLKIKVRSPDFSVVGHGECFAITSNLIKLKAPLGFIPLEGYIMEVDQYNLSKEEIKLLYAFMSDVTFIDGKSQYGIL